MSGKKKNQGVLEKISINWMETESRISVKLTHLTGWYQKWQKEVCRWGCIKASCFVCESLTGKLFCMSYFQN